MQWIMVSDAGGEGLGVRGHTIELEKGNAIELDVLGCVVMETRRAGLCLH